MANIYSLPLAVNGGGEGLRDQVRRDKIVPASLLGWSELGDFGTKQNGLKMGVYFKLSS